MNKQNAALLSVFSNSGLVIFKIFAGILMGSVSVLAEAIHSAIDLLASCVAFISIKKASEPADNDHQFGHGKYENISGAFEAVLIFIAAGIILYEAIKKLMHPGDIERIGWGIGVMGVSTLVNFFISRKLFSIAKKTNSIALEADAMHLSVDVFTSLGVVVGLIIIKITGLHILDPVIAILVAGLIIKASIDLTRKALGDLADKALPQEEISTIHAVLASHPSVLNHHKLRTRKSGERREIDLHVRVVSHATVAQAHDLCNALENDIKKSLPGSYVTIHVEPEHKTDSLLKQ